MDHDDLSGRYTFGDNDDAITRLGFVDALFGATTDAFLAGWAPGRPERAIDLGCGPGFTTLALARVCRPRALMGIDASPAMVDAAADALASWSEAQTVVHDVTSLPLPGAPADVIHARYLLAHLPDPTGLLDAWATQLAPAGRLLIEELDAIESTLPPFTTYLDTVTALVASGGADMHAGRVIAGHVPAGTTVVRDEAVVIPRPTSTVARMFALNLSVWRHEPWVIEHVPATTVERLAGDLAELSRQPDPDPEAPADIVWTHRQLVAEAPAR